MVKDNELYIYFYPRSYPGFVCGTPWIAHPCKFLSDFKDMICSHTREFTWEYPLHYDCDNYNNLLEWPFIHCEELQTSGWNDSRLKTTTWYTLTGVDIRYRTGRSISNQNMTPFDNITIIVRKNDVFLAIYNAMPSYKTVSLWLLQ